MHGNEQACVAATARRASAEADEIAMRAARMRRRGVPVLDGYPALKSGGDDMLRIQGVPEANLGFQVEDFAAGIWDQDDRRPIAWGVVFLWLAIVLVLLVGFVFGWLIGSMWNWVEVADFVAPTAAQARDMGWVALSEGR